MTECGAARPNSDSQEASWSVPTPLLTPLRRASQPCRQKWPISIDRAQKRDRRGGQEGLGSWFDPPVRLHLLGRRSEHQSGTLLSSVPPQAEQAASYSKSKFVDAGDEVDSFQRDPVAAARQGSDEHTFPEATGFDTAPGPARDGEEPTQDDGASGPPRSRRPKSIAPRRSLMTTTTAAPTQFMDGLAGPGTCKRKAEQSFGALGHSRITLFGLEFSGVPGVQHFAGIPPPPEHLRSSSRATLRAVQDRQNPHIG